ncbi:hypothetical protein [Actinokineospora terrae]|uniref:Uncharacterized protein n=1 Tax=Actinokineospora terrae TaxID=155974 RepID=A0A1H9VC91_9PSEU|nr:hypothetical protein [Actinokineospora terrae]SES19420.1 hypothetical protein SAMN04487818_108265 [Actinokineospora terrae]
MSERNSRVLATALPAATTAVGLLAVAVGVFLPWFRSGSVLRDSFQAVGVISTLGFLDGTALEVLLYAWYGVVPAITLSIVLYALGMRATAATIGAFLAIVTGTVSGGATVESSGGDSPLGIAAAGPTTTLIGSALAVLGAVWIVVNGRRGASRIAGGEP